MSKWRLILWSAGMCLLVICEPVVAFEVAPTDAAMQRDELSEIVVTAERRSVGIEHIPIAITAYDGAALREAVVTDPEALNKLVPGLTFFPASTSGNFVFIRGVGAQPLNGLTDQANAISQDGVFFSQPTGPEASLYDLDRVEVLKGPQGTLYGRNATGGAVNIITNAPKLDAWNGFAEETLGNYSLHQTEFALNAPLGSTTAVRVAGNFLGHDGYFEDGYDDAHVKAMRVRFLWQPSDQQSLLLTADGAEIRGMGPATIPFGPNPAQGIDGRFLGNPWDGPTAAAINGFVQSHGHQIVGGPFGPSEVDPFATAAGSDGELHNDLWSTSGIYNIDFGPTIWTTVVGHRKTETRDNNYVAYDNLATNFGSSETTIETRLSSPTTQAFQWIAGLFWGRDQQSDEAWPVSQTLAPAHPLFPPATSPDYLWFNAPRLSSETKALFGQITQSVTPDFRVTLGGRYTWDDKSLGPGTQGFVNGRYSTTPYPTLVIPAIPPVFPGATIPGGFSPLDAHTHFDAFTFTAGLEYDLTPDNLLYTNVRKGYHAGGLQQGDSVGPVSTTYAPETVIAYAAGSKNTFFEKRLVVNAELYLWNYDNLQVPGLGLVNCGTCVPNAGNAYTNQTVLSPLITNAGKARTFGLDSDARWLLTRDDIFSLGVLLDKGYYIQYDTAQGKADGRPMILLPDWTVTAGYMHTFTIGSVGLLELGARTEYVGQRSFSAVAYPGSTQPGFTSTDLNLTFRDASRHYSVGLWVLNVENGTNLVTGSGVNSVTDTGWGMLYPPRTYGVKGSVNF